ncbi:MAG: D-alanine--D-alanine ligase [Planctomycetota bacterium]
MKFKYNPLNPPNQRLELFRQKKLPIAVFLGGFSSEREISLKSGQAVAKALTAAGYPVQIVDVIGPQIKELSKSRSFREKGRDKPTFEVVFIALHGKFGEDGELQALLDCQKIIYTGSGAGASRNAMDKIQAKKLFVKHQVPTPDYLTFSQSVVSLAEPQDSSAVLRTEIKRLGYPVVVKPRAEGSTVGISIVQDDTFLPGALNKAFKYPARYSGTEDEVLIEKFIKGRELTVGILEEQPLPIIEIKTGQNFYDYQAKYQDATTEYLVNPDLPAGVVKKVQAAALKAHQVLGCNGFSRVDVRLSEENEPFVLEVNTIPGLTERSLLPKAAAAAGINFTQLCEKIIELALLKPL